ncbi:hypothetical protein GWO43_06865 [candidate division KSB1 bacterium]|nr:hypothetical protein [candidate division KSB1 bacterium]NIR72656.1 hypothetical protein [candidate division KSB1 bacterium]NIS23686.1 hypothetical protein [candidate division KSB1 bacterium]NIT70606.1 hypothetical protein [candidate division KSB1 bacterium]NIU24334.1 hypothetical protein [candidate division KSB1 bacterium]
MMTALSQLTVLMSFILNISDSASGQISSFTEYATFELQPGVKLQIVAAPFDSTKHSIERCKIVDWTGVCLIDNEPVFGTDWEIPRSSIKRIYLKVNDRKIELESSSMFNPWFTKPDERSFSLQRWTQEGWIVRGYFSDAAGSYVAEWRVIKDKSIRTVISSDESIIISFFHDKK